MPMKKKTYIFPISSVYLSVNGDDKARGTSPLEPVRSFQKAIDLCQELQITNIFVQAGIFFPGKGLEETGPGIKITVSKLKISGGWNNDFTRQSSCSILNGNYNNDYRVIFIENQSNIILEGITVINGNASTQKGGGIAVIQSQNIIIRHCTFSNNYAQWVGGISILNSSNIVIIENWIISNSSYSDPFSGSVGGMQFENSHGRILKNVICNNISGGKGGGSAISANGDSYIAENIWSNNISLASHGGGVMLLRTSDKTIFEKNIVINNHTAFYGGGVFLYVECDAVVRNNTIIGNSAGSEGGGIEIGFATQGIRPVVTNNSVMSNYPDEIHVSEGNVPILMN